MFGRLNKEENMKNKKPGSKGKANSWSGDTPESCDICEGPMSDRFVDGKTSSGPWALMCVLCHARHGVGLGAGKGHKYDAATGALLED